MQKFEADYGDVDQLTINEIKSRIASITTNVDFKSFPNDYYKNLYIELLKDPNNRSALMRQGILRKKESGINDDKLTNKKRLRGII